MLRVGSRNRETEKVLHFREDDKVAFVRFNLRLEGRAQEYRALRLMRIRG